MNRIFLPLGSISVIFLMIAFVLGLQIDDPKVLDRAVQQGVQNHFLAALAALFFATLVHAIVLTYFMGTGRWLEETSTAYRLPPTAYEASKAIKYRVIPAMCGCFLLLVITGAFGAAADPGSPVQFQGWLGFSPTAWHRTLAIITIVANVGMHYVEYLALFRNGEIIEGVMTEVRRIRQEKGLAV
ncbi:MAG TPA: hypothetical protein VFG20_13840 [Planctomycetaceae bacterium]|jgi:hypothetical protein|nr:hypothetical protein [Planctomycetaceae bacterium]